jgi:opacity protein-like surface antigen
MADLGGTLMKTSAAVLAVALALLAAPAALAQPVSARSGPDTYLELDLGAFLPQAKDLDSFDPGVALSGTFGAMFSRYVGAEASLGYYRATATLAAAPLATDVALNVMPVLVNLRVMVPFKAMEFSARAGPGIHFASLHASGGASAWDTATAFGFQAGASAAFNLSPTTLVGLDALWTFAEAKFEGVNTKLDGVIVSVKLGYRL